MQHGMPDLPVPPCLRDAGDHLVLSVKAQPRASRSELAGLHGAELKIKVAAPPVDSAANEALIALLAGLLHVGKRQVVLVRGATSAHKVFHLHGVTLQSAARVLQ